MDYSFDSALEDELITVIERDDDEGHYCIKIGELQTHVTIELGRYMTSDRTKFFVSHAIKTPTQLDAYRTSLPFGDSPDAALLKAISGLTMYYRQAVTKGHHPHEDWLVEY